MGLRLVSRSKASMAQRGSRACPLSIGKGTRSTDRLQSEKLGMVSKDGLSSRVQTSGCEVCKLIERLY